MATLMVLMPSLARGGSEDHTLVVSTAAVRAGWQVHIAFPASEATAALRAEFAAAGVTTHVADFAESFLEGRYRLHRHLRDYQNGRRTRHLLRRVRPDVTLVSLPWFSNMYGTQRALARARCPSVIVFHAIAPGSTVRADEQQEYARFRRRQTWVAVSDYSRGLIAETLKAPRKEITLIPNGVPLDAVPDASRDGFRADVRREFGLPAESRMLITVARFDDRKGHALIVPEIRRIVSAHPDVFFVWVGDGENEAALRSSLQQAGMADRVIFTGRRTDVRRLMAASDIFLFPTYLEAMSLTLLEAMASHLPIVSSDACSIPEVITHGEHGWLFPTGDSAALGAAVLDALATPERAAAMARAARLRVGAFSQARMCDDYLRLFASLAPVAAPAVSPR